MPTSEALREELKELVAAARAQTIHNAHVYVTALVQEMGSSMDPNEQVPWPLIKTRDELLGVPDALPVDVNGILARVAETYSRTEMEEVPLPGIKTHKIRNLGCRAAVGEYFRGHPNEHVTIRALYEALKARLSNITLKDVIDIVYQAKKGIVRIPGGTFVGSPGWAKYVPDAPGGKSAPPKRPSVDITVSSEQVRGISDMLGENPALGGYVYDCAELAVTARNALRHVSEITMFHEALVTICNASAGDPDGLARMEDYLHIVYVKGNYAVPLMRWVLEHPDDLGRALDEQFLSNDRLGERAWKPKLYDANPNQAGHVIAHAPNAGAPRTKPKNKDAEQAAHMRGNSQKAQSPRANETAEEVVTSGVKYDAALALVASNANQSLDEAAFIEMLAMITKGFPGITEEEAHRFYAAIWKGGAPSLDGVVHRSQSSLKYMPLSGKAPIDTHLSRVKTMEDVYLERPDFKAYFALLEGFHLSIVAARAALRERAAVENFYNSLAKLERAYHQTIGLGRTRQDFLDIVRMGDERAAIFVDALAKNTDIHNAHKLIGEYGNGVVKPRYDPASELPDYMELQPVGIFAVEHSVIRKR